MNQAAGRPASDLDGTEALRLGRRLALASLSASVLLSATNIAVGWLARSTSAVAIGLEFAGDVLAALVVLFGMSIASKPADADHPYGHGRSEMLAGMIVGMILVLGGLGIALRSLVQAADVHSTPAAFAIWPLVGSIVVRGTMSTLKFRYGRRMGSASLVADAWNDAVDILSAIAALAGLGLSIYDPTRFLAADHYGGFAVGVVVVVIGLRVMREASLQLMDTMPDEMLMREIRATAARMAGVRGVEKCYARKTGLQYHVDLHLEVDPDLTVRESHDIATEVRYAIRQQMPFVADVLVHVEPDPHAPSLPSR